MAEHRPWERLSCVVPPHAVAEWLELNQALADAGTVPCTTDDAGDWWPDGHATRAAAARRALAGCRRCAVAAACLAYALAADERFGIWGGTLPEQRRAMRWGVPPQPVTERRGVT